ncbi:MAG: hypothetical protein A2Y88_02540 [Chloroflexi bacterium RBG_13_48_10]|nr:MAG: hypothetical protein A2Y88_02540 [Chloroflexi bacterium RBG_13_48_10]
MVRLTDIERGKQVKIIALEGDSRYMTRLNQSGLYPGDLAKVVRIAPFDGPVLLEVCGMEIALGKSFAERILVEVVPCVSL